MVINIIILWGFITGVLCGVLLNEYIFKSQTTTVIEHSNVGSYAIDKPQGNDKWIPVSDTLPLNTKDVLVVWKWKGGYWRTFSIAKCLWAPDGKRTWMVESHRIGDNVQATLQRNGVLYASKLDNQIEKIEVLAWKPIEPFY